MKKFLITLGFLLAAITAYSADKSVETLTPFANVGEYNLSLPVDIVAKDVVLTLNDTVKTVDVTGAKRVFLIWQDSSDTKVDSGAVLHKVKGDGSLGYVSYSPISMILTNATSKTTFTASSLFIPGDATTACYELVLGSTGYSDLQPWQSLYIYRKNVNGVGSGAGYTPRSKVTVLLVK